LSHLPFDLVSRDGWALALSRAIPEAAASPSPQTPEGGLTFVYVPQHVGRYSPSDAATQSLSLSLNWKPWRDMESGKTRSLTVA
jgi:hypothetical protein